MGCSRQVRAILGGEAMARRMALLSGSVLLLLVPGAVAGFAAPPAGAQQYPPAQNLLTVSDPTPCPDDYVGVDARTFHVNGVIGTSLVGGAGPIALWDVQPRLPTADDQGVFQYQVRILPEVPPGRYTLEVLGPSPQDDEVPLVLTTDIEVLDCSDPPTLTTMPSTGSAGDLPRTGSGGSLGYLRAAFGLVAAGGALAAAARRPRPASAG